MTAREAYALGTTEFVRALEESVRQFVAGLDDKTRDLVDGSAVVHGVTDNQRGGFYAAVAYGLWEVWGPVDPPFPCPAGLISGYRAEEALHEHEFRPQVSGPHSRECAEVVTLSRIFERRLAMLHPTGDPDQPRRLQLALGDVAREIPERAARYGVATGIALRFLSVATDLAMAREEWLRPILAADALAEWAGTGAVWVDVVKVGPVDAAVREFAPTGDVAYALRHGTERDYKLTILTCVDDRALVSWSAHVKAKRFGSGQAIEPAVVPPTVHLWALSQLGFTSVVVGEYEFEIDYMMDVETLTAIREELIGAAKGTVVPLRDD